MSSSDLERQWNDAIELEDWEMARNAEVRRHELQQPAGDTALTLIRITESDVSIVTSVESKPSKYGDPSTENPE